MTYIYKSASGREVSAHSYSAGSEFKFCRRKYKLHRILGWQEKAKKAALEFGKCLESALQYYHENGLKSGDFVDEFKRLWLKWKEIDLEYTEADSDWGSLYTVGSEQAALYEVLLPTLPIHNPKFQLEYRKELWPGSGLEFLSYVDLLSTAEDGSRLVVDIKTAKLPLNLDKNMLSLDPQLRRYAWVTGIRDVAFLWFVKAKPESFKKGDTVTLLGDTLRGKAGQVLTVAKYEEKTEDEVTTKMLTLGEAETVRLMDEALDQIKGKGSAEAKAKVITEHLADGRLCVVPREAITKTKLQFIIAQIPEEELPEIGDSIGHEIISVKDAAEKDKFPKDGGVRWPNNQCVFCSYRGICTDNAALRDELLIQISATKENPKEDDWLSEMGE